MVAALGSRFRLQKVDRSAAVDLFLFVACMASRLVTTIYYVEDPDSLRFALSVYDSYDISRLQPHFPGYPVFWLVAKGFYLATGSFALSFSLIGGLSTFAIVYFSRRILAVRADSVEGISTAAVIFFSPLLWLLGNRYMPDLMGLAVMIAALSYLFQAGRRPLTRPPAGAEEEGVLSARSALVGSILAGLLCGVRLSFVPFILIPVADVFVRRHLRRPAFLGFVSGIAVWLVPVLAATGLHDLVNAAVTQASGHFTEFGGTLATEPDWGRRVVRLVQSLWSDGLGGYWPSRHALTVISGAGVLLVFAVGVSDVRRLSWGRREVVLLSGSAALYLLWILLYQNVIHKSRHVIPILFVVLVIVSRGAAQIWRRGKFWGRAGLLAGLTSYAAVALVLVLQHRQPTAIAQVRDFLYERTFDSDSDALHIVSIPLVNYFLSSQEVAARYVNAEATRESDLRSSLAEATRVYSVGAPIVHPGLELRSDTVFYHNPYVNRMWPMVEVHEYFRPE